MGGTQQPHRPIRVDTKDRGEGVERGLVVDPNLIATLQYRLIAPVEPYPGFEFCRRAGVLTGCRRRQSNRNR
jgi:hypothetical protein